MDKLAELRAKLIDARPGKWTAEFPIGGEGAIRCEGRHGMVGEGLNDDDAALIVAAVNALPALLAVGKAAREAAENIAGDVFLYGISEIDVATLVESMGEQAASLRAAVAALDAPASGEGEAT